MDTNNEKQLSIWVDGRMSALSPGDNWQPNVSAGLVRLKELQRTGRWFTRRWSWATVTATQRVFVLAAGAAACLGALVVALLLVPHRQKPSQPAEAKQSLADAPQLATLQSSRPIAGTPQLHMSTPVLTKLALDDSQAFDALLTNESRTQLPRMQSERSALGVLARE